MVQRDQDYAFTLTRDMSEGDGFTFEGYASVFNSPTHIRDQDGEYDEVILPGAFTRTIGRSKPVFMFDHGKHPLIGQMPLGAITDLKEDARGLFVRARMTDNWLISPVRDAIQNKAITGMSFRYEPTKETWTGKPNGRCRYGEVRTVREVRCPELGPVVSPAYADTTAAVRSALHTLEGTMPGIMRVELLRDNDGLIVTDDSADPQALVEDAIEKLWGLNDFQSDLGRQELHDTYLIFEVIGAKSGEYRGLWQVDYTYNNGAVTIGTPFQVKANGYIPIGDTAPSDLAQWDPHLNSAPLVGNERAYSADDRKKMAASGEALPDGSYPIANKADLQNAIHAIGRGSGSHNAIRQHIVKRAKALGASDMIPDSWNADGSVSGMNSQSEGPSEELAVTSPSEELAVAINTTPTQAERKQQTRRSYLDRHDIRKKDTDNE